MLWTLKFVLIPIDSIIIFHLRFPLETNNDCANVVGLVAKSDATHGDTLPPLFVSVSKKAPCAIDTVKYVICGSAGETPYNAFGSTVAIVV